MGGTRGQRSNRPKIEPEHVIYNLYTIIVHTTVINDLEKSDTIVTMYDRQSKSNVRSRVEILLGLNF